MEEMHGENITDVYNHEMDDRFTILVYLELVMDQPFVQIDQNVKQHVSGKLKTNTNGNKQRFACLFIYFCLGVY